MAEFRIEGDALVLRLTVAEKVAALHGDVRVPLAAVRAVELVDRPLAAARGLRAPGLALPGRKKIGTWRRHGERSFVVLRRGEPAVKVVLDGQRYGELVASVPDAARAVASLRSGAGR